MKDYYRGPYPDIFKKFLKNRESFKKFTESGLMIMTLPKEKQIQIQKEIKRSLSNGPIDELKIESLNDLYLFELETFNNKEGRRLLLGLKEAYKQILKTLPTEWKQRF
jgi:hypothetical protein